MTGLYRIVALKLVLHFYRLMYLVYKVINGDRGGTVVKVLYYKSEGCWFDPSCCQ